MPEDERVEVVAYDPRWPDHYAAERDALLAEAPGLVAIEHIGSTAVPGQRAKPVIDIMAAVESLDGAGPLLAAVERRGYRVVEVGMPPDRLFLRREAEGARPRFHLHLVERDSWEGRKERRMRDYLLRHPEAVEAYGALKDALAARHERDPLAYTEAKTAFVQELMDRVHDELGLPRVDVWET